MVAGSGIAERDILLLPLRRLLQQRLHHQEGKWHVANSELGQSERRRGESEQQRDTERKREKRLIGNDRERRRDRNERQHGNYRY